MKSKTVKFISITFLLFSLIGWVTFACFFAPEGFFATSEPPIAPSPDPVSLLYFFLFLIGITIPILSLLGLIISSILGIRERREEEVNPHWARKLGWREGFVGNEEGRNECSPCALSPD